MARTVNALKQLDLGQVYSPREALELVKEAAFAKFDETVDALANEP